MINKNFIKNRIYTMPARNLSLSALIPLAAACLWSVSGLATASDSQSELRAEGEKQFIRCVSCHSMSAEDTSPIGPHLEGIVGRHTAALPDFDYTDDLHQREFVWDEEQLDLWLTKPHEIVPGMCMPFMGLPKAEHRAALIEYLKAP
jgi:cytochrome c